MRNRWLAAILCLVAVAGLFVSQGCSPQASARRAHVIKRDLSRIPDEIDWLLGLDEPSILYEDTFPPYPGE